MIRSTINSDSGTMDYLIANGRTKMAKERDELLRVFREIRESLEADCDYIGYPKIVQDPDLSKFERQECEIPGVECEMIRQSDGGITGDMFNGDAAYLIGDEWWIIVEYAS